jgi:hypothetical protein
MSKAPSDSEETTDDQAQDTRVFCADGWTARIIKNEDDDGWAVAMTADGAMEPSLVGPWTMGRDKKNPKPLDASAFAVLLRGANEIMMRHAQQRRAQLHRTVMAEGEDGRVRVDLDIVPDEEDPHAVLTVFDRSDTVVSRTRVAPDFKLSAERAKRWLQNQGANGLG